MLTRYAGHEVGDFTQVYLAADVERVVGEKDAEITKLQTSHIEAFPNLLAEQNAMQAALAAKERELSERMADYTEWTLGFKHALAAKEASHEKDIRYLRGQYDSIVDIKNRIEAEKDALIAQWQARVIELGGKP